MEGAAENSHTSASETASEEEMEDTSSVSSEHQVGLSYCTCRYGNRHFRRCTRPCRSSQKSLITTVQLITCCILYAQSASCFFFPQLTFLSFCRLKLVLLVLALTSLGTHLVRSAASTCIVQPVMSVSAHTTVGEKRTTFPLTCYLAAGTQAEPGRQNFLILMKMFDLKSTHVHSDEVEGKEPSTNLCHWRLSIWSVFMHDIIKTRHR